MVWSIISKNEAKPKKVNPIGINVLFLIFLNFLIDLIPRNNGITIAWKCAKNKIDKNKLTLNPYLIIIWIGKVVIHLKREIYHFKITIINIVSTKGKAGYLLEDMGSKIKKV